MCKLNLGVNLKKENKVGWLLFAGSLLVLVYGLLLVYIELMIIENTRNVLLGIVSVLFAGYSLFSTFKFLGKASERAENDIKGLDLKAIAGFLFFSFLGLLITIHFAGVSAPSSGISVPGFFEWIYNNGFAWIYNN
jgi:hypothetical protein